MIELFLGRPKDRKVILEYHESDRNVRSFIRCHLHMGPIGKVMDLYADRPYTSQHDMVQLKTSMMRHDVRIADHIRSSLLRA